MLKRVMDGRLIGMVGRWRRHALLMHARVFGSLGTRGHWVAKGLLGSAMGR